MYLNKWNIKFRISLLMINLTNSITMILSLNWIVQIKIVLLSKIRFVIVVKKNIKTTKKLSTGKLLFNF